MGILFSYLPSIERNTMCCVDVRTKRACWKEEPSVHTQYHEVVVKKEPTIRYIVPKDQGPAGSIEYDATVDVLSPVDTESILREVHFNPRA
jgi:hypothetical protein